MTTSAEFPIAVTHNGQTYFATGKLGTNIRTGRKVQEMEADDSHRVWVATDGAIFAD